MSQPFKLRYQNEIVGGFVLSGVAALVVVLAFMARSKQWFEETFTCSVRFDSGNVALISDDMEVRIRSQVVGHVLSSRYDGKSRLIATLALGTRYRKAVHSDSEAVLYTPLAGLPGEPFIELKGGRDPTPVSVGGVLKGRAAEDLVQLATDVLTDARATLRPTLKEVEKLTRRLNGMLDTMAPEEDLPKLTKRLDKLLTRVDTVLANVDKLADGAGRVLTQVESGKGLVARALNDPRMVREVVELLVKVRGAADSMQRTLQTADRVALGADRLIGKTDRLVGKAGGAVDQLPGLVKMGKSTLQDLAQITAQLRKIAPKVPGLMGQVDDVLLETRAIISAAERHWLLAGTLRPSKAPKALPGRGLRDTPASPNETELRRLLGADAAEAAPGGAPAGPPGSAKASSAGGTP